MGMKIFITCAMIGMAVSMKPKSKQITNQYWKYSKENFCACNLRTDKGAEDAVKVTNDLVEALGTVYNCAKKSKSSVDVKNFENLFKELERQYNKYMYVVPE